MLLFRLLPEDIINTSLKSFYISTGLIILLLVQVPILLSHAILTVKKELD